MTSNISKEPQPNKRDMVCFLCFENRCECQFGISNHNKTENFKTQNLSKNCSRTLVTFERKFTLKII